MARVTCYVDGFNMYHALEATGQSKFKWLNLKALATTFLQMNDVLVATYYFTAVVTHDAKKCARHRAYIDAQKAVGVEVVESKFQSVNRHCRTSQKTCPFLEEKQTDVALSTRLLVDAMENVMDRAILISADSDHVPTVRLLREKRPTLLITLAPPPGRMGSARELGAILDDRREIKLGRLEQCLLPRTVYKADGRVAATCPAAYGLAS